MNEKICTIRRRFVLTLGGALASIASPVLMAGSTQGEFNKLAVKSLPVFGWLIVGESTESSVRPVLQSTLNSGMGAIFNEGESEITQGGSLLSLSQVGGPGIEGEDGLRLLSMAFGRDRKLAWVSWMVERGVRDARVEPLINRMIARYGSQATPITVADTRGEATDFYVLFDMGRFIVEVAVPQHGTFATVLFCTRAIYDILKREEGTDDLLLAKLSTK